MDADKGTDDVTSRHRTDDEIDDRASGMRTTPTTGLTRRGGQRTDDDGTDEGTNGQRMDDHNMMDDWTNDDGADTTGRIDRGRTTLGRTPGRTDR